MRATCSTFLLYNLLIGLLQAMLASIRLSEALYSYVRNDNDAMSQALMPRTHSGFSLSVNGMMR